jgi:hypothetical protein
MPLSNTEIRDFQGLYLQQNSFTVPDGAMEDAVNVMIQSDGIISKTRGWYTFYTPEGSPGPEEDIRGLYEFQDKLIYAAQTGDMYWFSEDDTLDIYSPLGVPTLVTGDGAGFADFVGLGRSAKQNLNLYMTTNDGIYALENYLGPVRRAGVPPALDLSAEEGTSSVGPLPPDSQTAYRAVFGRRDVNGNLLLGAPSDIATVGVRPDGTGYSYTATGVGPYVVTVNVTDNSGFSTGQEIIVTNGSDPDVDGTQTITIPSLSTTSIEFTVVNNPGVAGTLDISFSREALLVAGLPSEINDTAFEWFVRWYRTTASAGLAVSPTPDFALIGEQVITTADIAAKQVTFVDDVDPGLIGGQLYTNPNSREGEVQANARPPAAKDITLYNTYMMYANVETRQFINLQLVNFLLPNIPYEFRIRLLATTETYYGYSSGVANQTVAATSVSGTGTITITYNAHGASNGWTVYVSNVVGGSLPAGIYTVSGVTANTFDITSSGNSATGLDFSFVNNGLGGVFYNPTNLASPAQMITLTAQYLVKSINRVSNLFYANYVSTFDDAPGKIRVSTKQIYLFDDMRISCDTDNNNWIPPLPTSFSTGVQVKAENHTFPDALYFSKADEPEAVPVVNFLRIGSRNKPIQRIFALRDCLIILKEDGVFVLTGQVIQDFNVSTLDATVFFNTDRTADKINNTVIALSNNQGLVQVTEKSVNIISRRIDDVIQPILGFQSALSTSLGFGHESGRLYYLSINTELLGREPQTFLYNVLNQTYTETDLTFRQMVIGPSDQLYASTTAEQNVIIRQRKSQTLIDFSNEFMTGTALASDTTTATLTLDGNGSSLFTIEVGDVIVYNEVINRIEAIEDDGLGNFIVTFPATTNIPTSGSPVDVIVYEGFESSIKMAPFHAGAVGREKQFSSMQLHLRQNSISELNITWGSAYFGSSGEVDWSASTSGNSSSGWGFEPWGLFPWGLADSIRLQAGTTPGVIIRTWVTKFAARTTYIQAVVSHRQACEQILLQALSYAVRGYSDRTTR